jgi:hypothetical protein
MEHLETIVRVRAVIREVNVDEVVAGDNPQSGA